jgi:hypothetical protein
MSMVSRKIANKPLQAAGELGAKTRFVFLGCYLPTCLTKSQEVYLLQTRLQKMPYKHIAAHLKKTELACRLHYHQLSHGSNRRKRTTSVSSGSSSVNDPSPTMTAAGIASRMPSPIHEASNPSTPASYIYQNSPPTNHIHLPSLLPHPGSTSPQRNLAAILPKPSPRRSISESNAALRLDCAVSPTHHTTTPATHNSMVHIDAARLAKIYETHRVAFWATIAADYGPSASPAMLEQAWRQSSAALAPPTPCVSPDGNSYLQEMVKETKTISVSTLLGIDASPRSPKERELIRMMEERRENSVMA